MARFEHITDVVKSLCLRSGDLLQRNKGLYLDCANDTFNDLNTDVLRLAERVKMPIRTLFSINKRTNSIDLPCNFLKLSSVNIMDNKGIMYPVFRNERLHDDIVEVSAARDCACEFNCGYKLCNTIKGYEAVQSVKSDFLPNGDPISFNCIDRKALSGGFLYEETQNPQRVYLSGVWTNTIKGIENKKLCAVEVDHNGCVCDSEHNINAVCDSCGISNINENKCCIGGDANNAPSKNCDTWKYYCSSRLDWFETQCGGFPFGFHHGCNNIYNISELGDRLIFPHNFGWDKVVVRYYADIDLNDLWIPYMAKEVFMTGLQYFASTHNDKKQQQAAMYSQKYSKQKWALFLEFNKYRIEELRMIMTPPVYVPSFISNRHGHN